MNRRILKLIAGLTVVGALGAAQAARAGETIVTGTSCVRELAQRLCGTNVSFQNLLPPEVCPGHYDMRPMDIEAVANCRAVILQPWQHELAGVQNVLRAADIASDRVLTVPVEGNWMLPETRARAAKAMGDLLAGEMPDLAEAIRAAADDEARASNAVNDWARETAEAHQLAGTAVLCNEQQADFVRWLGLNVVRTFGRPDAMSVGEVNRLLASGKAHSVVLVVNNLQGGDPEFGERLAHHVGAAHVVLSNFPGAGRGEETWEDTVKANVRRLIEAAPR